MDGWSKSWTTISPSNETTSHSASGMCKKIMKFAKLDNQWLIVQVDFKGCG